MKRAILLVAILGMVSGCGKKDKDPFAAWFKSPEKVVEGIMSAYETRNDTLYASFLADDFAYYFEPQGAESTDVLTWGKGEEVLSASSLFKTADVQEVSLVLEAERPRPEPGPAGRERMRVPVTGGRLTIAVKAKEPTVVTLNRQALVLEKFAGSPARWLVVEWHDYPEPIPGEGGPSAPASSAVVDTAHAGHAH